MLKHEVFLCIVNKERESRVEIFQNHDFSPQKSQSHPIRMRGLKQEMLMRKQESLTVASYMDAIKIVKNQSHLMLLASARAYFLSNPRFVIDKINRCKLKK